MEHVGRWIVRAVLGDEGSGDVVRELCGWGGRSCGIESFAYLGVEG